jgi:hypothetical protein
MRVMDGSLRVEGCEVPVFQLLQWKYAIRLEGAGLRHSSGRSVKAHAARKLGLSARAPRAEVLAKIESFLSRVP